MVKLVDFYGIFYNANGFINKNLGTVIIAALKCAPNVLYYVLISEL